MVSLIFFLFLLCQSETRGLMKDMVIGIFELSKKRFLVKMSKDYEKWTDNKNRRPDRPTMLSSRSLYANSLIVVIGAIPEGKEGVDLEYLAKKLEHEDSKPATVSSSKPFRRILYKHTKLI